MIQFNIKKAQPEDFSKLPPIIALKQNGPHKVDLYSNSVEDIDKLIKILSKRKDIDERFLSPRYWQKLANNCKPDFGPNKILESGKVASKKMKSGRRQFNLKKMYRCCRCKCHEGNRFECRNISESIADFLVCGCVTKDTNNSNRELAQY